MISTYRNYFARRLLGSLYKNNDGLAALEFAMITPIVMLIVMGTIEFSMIMFTMSTMESATSSSSRMGKTGYVAAGSTRQQQITNNIINRTGTLLNAQNLVITTRVYSNLSDIGDPEPFIDSNHNGTRDSGETYTDSNGNGQWDVDMGIAGLGGAGDIVVYTVTYPWQIMTPIMSNIIGSVFNISVRTVVKNEPYSG